MTDFQVWCLETMVHDYKTATFPLSAAEIRRSVISRSREIDPQPIDEEALATFLHNNGLDD